MPQPGRFAHGTGGGFHKHLFMTLKICVAQLNFIVGDLAGNAQKIAEAAQTAYAQGVRLLLTPELSLCGYAAEDLYLRPAFMQACEQTLQALAAQLASLRGMSVVVGHPQGGDQRGPSVSVNARHNCASVLQNGAIVLQAMEGKSPCVAWRVF